MSEFRRRKKASYYASADTTRVLAAADSVGLLLSDSELQTICYFTRVVSHAWHQLSEGVALPFPYAFSFGENGGPVATALVESVQSFVQLGFVYREPVANHPEVHTVRIVPEQAGLWRTLVEEEPPGDIMEYANGVCSSALVMSVPGLIKAIRFEPSLRQARVQGLRAGVPLGERQSEVVGWLQALTVRQEVAEQLSEHKGLVATVLLDAFLWVQERSEVVA